MGILRIAIVVAAGVALLPSDREQQQRLMQRASDATTWVVTYCDRNAAHCTQAAGLWTQFVAKAEFGAKLAYDMMKDTGSERQTADAGDERVRCALRLQRLNAAERSPPATSDPPGAVNRARAAASEPPPAVDGLSPPSRNAYVP